MLSILFLVSSFGNHETTCRRFCSFPELGSTFYKEFCFFHLERITVLGLSFPSNIPFKIFQFLNPILIVLLLGQ